MLLDFRKGAPFVERLLGFAVCASVENSFEDGVSMWYWWDDNWLWKLKYSEKNFSQCQLTFK
jgi:hypothetical protein